MSCSKTQIAAKRMVSSLKHQGFGKCAERLAYLQSTDDLEKDDKPLSL